MHSSRSSNHSERALPRRAVLALLGAGTLASLAGGRSLLFGCSRTDEAPPNRQEVLRQTVRIVMLPTLAQLAQQADALSAAGAALRDTPSAEAAAAARSAWRAAFATWKRSEAFLLGPSDDLAVTGGAIDSRPADGAKLDALVAGTETLDEARVGTLAANLRGFPGIEYLLFDAAAGLAEADRRLLDDALAGRRRALLASQCADLAKKCRAVSDAWSVPQGFGHQLAEAGVDSSAYTFQRDAVDDVVTALLACAELVHMAKLGKPLGADSGGTPRPELEEAPRSDSSLLAIEHNLLGLQAVYTCTLDGVSGESLSGEVRKTAAHADDSFRQALDAALASVRGMTSSMRTLLVSDVAALSPLHEAAGVVKRNISTNIASALGASLGFGYSDTD